jgi:hypothetical protein
MQGEVLFVYFNIFLAEFENIKRLQKQNELTEIEQLLVDINIKEYDNNNPLY